MQILFYLQRLNRTRINLVTVDSHQLKCYRKSLYVLKSGKVENTRKHSLILDRYTNTFITNFIINPMTTKNELTEIKSEVSVSEPKNLIQSFLEEQFDKLSLQNNWGLNSRIKRTFSRPQKVRLNPRLTTYTIDPFFLSRKD